MNEEDVKIQKHPPENSGYRVGDVVEINGLESCVVIGFSSVTGAIMVYSYKLQNIICAEYLKMRRIT